MDRDKINEVLPSQWVLAPQVSLRSDFHKAAEKKNWIGNTAKNSIAHKEIIKLSKNNDFIFGSRYKGSGGSDDDDIVTFIGNKIFTFITRYILGIKLSDILYTYVLCNVDKFNNLNLKNNDFKLCIELPVKVKKKNHTYVDLAMFERKRYDGKKKVNVIKDGLLISYEIFKSFFYIYFK